MQEFGSSKGEPSLGQQITHSVRDAGMIVNSKVRQVEVRLELVVCYDNLNLNLNLTHNQ
jgi:hypothetical protein